jgi:integrase
MAEGVPPAAALQRYLDFHDLRHVRARHQQLVDQVQALAKRRGDSRWRLIGIDISDAHELAPVAPTLQEWAAEEGLEDWSESELQAMYLERFDSEQANWKRRRARGARLRQHKLALLLELEHSVSHAARPTDLIDGWFPERTLVHLRALGVRFLADLDRLIARGGRWWSPAPGFGPGKARRVEALLHALLQERPSRAWPLQEALAALRVGGAAAKRPPEAGLEDDSAAIAAWLASHDRTKSTAEQYAREAERFRLWCLLERRRSLADVQPADCSAYGAFLAAIPDHWISRRRARPLTPGWAPFRGQLTEESQRLAMTIVRGMYQWMMASGYLVTNPWIGSGKPVPAPALARWKRESPTPIVLPDPARQLAGRPSFERMRWLLSFSSDTGLGLANLAAARRGDLARKAGHWTLRRAGEGARVAVSDHAIEQTRRYFRARGQDFDTADADVPLLASLTTPSAGIGYRAVVSAANRFSMWHRPGIPNERRLRGAWWLRAASPNDMLRAELGGAAAPRSPANV